MYNQILSGVHQDKIFLLYSYPKWLWLVTKIAFKIEQFFIEILSKYNSRDVVDSDFIAISSDLSFLFHIRIKTFLKWIHNFIHFLCTWWYFINCKFFERWSYRFWWFFCIFRFFFHEWNWWVNLFRFYELLMGVFLFYTFSLVT